MNQCSTVLQKDGGCGGGLYPSSSAITVGWLAGMIHVFTICSHASITILRGWEYTCGGNGSFFSSNLDAAVIACILYTNYMQNGMI